MADLLAALALLTFAGVVGLVAMVIALYVHQRLWKRHTEQRRRITTNRTKSAVHTV